MAETLRIFWQVAPAAATDTNSAAVPVNQAWVVGYSAVCNRTAGAITIRWAVRGGGAALGDQHWQGFGKVLPANTTWSDILKGLAIPAGSIIVVRAESAGTSWTFSGVEVTV